MTELERIRQMNDEELNLYKRYLLNYRVYVKKLKQTNITVWI